MPVSIVDRSSGLAPLLASTIERSRDVRIAVAFASTGGLDLIRGALLQSLDGGAQLEFIVGMDLAGTDPAALWALYQLGREQPDLRLYCCAHVREGCVYHPKLYVMQTSEETIAVIGSSNLTEGGLQRNDEVNAVIHGTGRDESICDVYAAYNRLKFGPHTIEPDDELLERYQALCEIQKPPPGRSAEHERARKLVRELRSKVQALHRPTATRRDLVGWLELVYDNLPDGEFTTRQVYALKGEFARHYPANQNVEAKIRQQLQMLRDMGLVEHLGRGHWRKL